MKYEVQLGCRCFNKHLQNITDKSESYLTFEPVKYAYNTLLMKKQRKYTSCSGQLWSLP